ncbi:MAG: DUF6603 domain-containing protein [Saprospiraceae bacterium]
MDNTAGTIELILLELSKLLQPLTNELSPSQAEVFFGEIGLNLTPAQVNTLANSMQTTVTHVQNSLAQTNSLVTHIAAEDYGAIAETSIQLIQSIKQAIESFPSLATTIDGLNAGIPQAVIDKIPKRIFDALLYRYLGQLQGINEFLKLFTILQQTNLALNPDDPPILLSSFQFDHIGDLFTNPRQVLQQAYGWGANGFDGTQLFPALEAVLNALNIPAFYDDNGTPYLDLVLLALKADATSSPPGLAATLRSGISTGEIRLVEEDDWYIDLDLSFLLPFDAKLLISPQGNFDLITAMGTTGGALDLSFTADRSDQDEKFILLGQVGGSRLEIGKLAIGTGVELSWDPIAKEGSGKFKISGALTQGKVKIDFSEGDGFLKNILGNLNLESNFDLGFDYQSENGLVFHGSGALEIELPLHLDLGVIEVDALRLSLGIDQGEFPVDIGTNIKAKLGPLNAVVEDIGMRANFSFPENDAGNLGPVNLGIGFKPPNGVGLSLDAGVLKGGGYLFFDYDREEYAGALELVFSEWIAIKAIGLVTTKMPDGSKGFSLLIILTVGFGSGIQLGFGFTLLKVGGLLGLNRTVNIDALSQGITTGAIESVMFPENIVENAPRIISDLRSFFPPQEGVFLIGPMIEIGYGTPTLLSLSMGLILEIPPGNITILGILKTSLPDERAALLVLQVNFIGRLDFTKKHAWFYAFLFESRVLFITLEGGMGLLIDWGDSSNFVVSVGGFHPSFNPPPLPFDEPPRIAANLLNLSAAKVRLEAYFAVTSNTVQFGARVELFFGVSAFNIDGHLAFDALFQFSPFYFIFQISVKLAVKVFGFGLFSVHISGALEGPTPWRIKGKGRLKICWFIKISVPIDITWGDQKDTELPPIEVMPLLVQEIETQSNWQAFLPKGKSILVSLRALDDSDSDTLVLHPVGHLRISQRKVPLGLKLEKFGNQKPSDANVLDFDFAANAELSVLDTVEEKFAMAQFKEIDDSKKLSLPAFEPQTAGVDFSVSGDQVRTGKAVKRIIRYETVIIDNNFKRFIINVYQFLVQGFVNMYAVLFSHFLKGNSVAKSSISKNYKDQLQPEKENIQINPDLYTVANIKNNKALDASTTTFTSKAKAQDYLQQQLAQNPALTDSIHVIPNTEVNTAA